MVAIAAVVLFALSLIFQIANYGISIFTSQTFLIAGLLCVALHLAGVGTSRGSFRRSRR